MLTININEAQKRFLELMKQAQNGEAFIIADNDKPLAQLVPYAPPKKTANLALCAGMGLWPKIWISNP